MKKLKQFVFFVAIISILFNSVVFFRMIEKSNRIDELQILLNETLDNALHSDIIQKSIPPRGQLIVAIYDDYNKYNTVEDVWSAIGTWDGISLNHSYKEGDNIITYTISYDPPLAWIPLPSDFDKFYVNVED
jgi:hypothetical protein